MQRWQVLPPWSESRAAHIISRPPGIEAERRKKMELRITTADIQATDIKSAIAEIESNEDTMSTIEAMSIRSGIAIGDMVEAVASHIVIEDEDYVLMDAEGNTI
jgi:hypothetical protein